MRVLSTPKKYLYYLVISQLYNDGFSKQASELEILALETNRNIRAGDKLNKMFANCVLSVNDASFFFKHQGPGSKLSSNKRSLSNSQASLNKKRKLAEPNSSLVGLQDSIKKCVKLVTSDLRKTSDLANPLPKQAPANANGIKSPVTSVPSSPVMLKSMKTASTIQAMNTTPTKSQAPLMKRSISLSLESPKSTKTADKLSIKATSLKISKGAISPALLKGIGLLKSPNLKSLNNPLSNPLNALKSLPTPVNKVTTHPSPVSSKLSLSQLPPSNSRVSIPMRQANLANNIVSKTPQVVLTHSAMTPKNLPQARPKANSLHNIHQAGAIAVNQRASLVNHQPVAKPVASTGHHVVQVVDPVVNPDNRNTRSVTRPKTVIVIDDAPTLTNVLKAAQSSQGQDQIEVVSNNVSAVSNHSRLMITSALSLRPSNPAISSPILQVTSPPPYNSSPSSSSSSIGLAQSLQSSTAPSPHKTRSRSNSGKQKEVQITSPPVSQFQLTSPIPASPSAMSKSPNISSSAQVTSAQSVSYSQPRAQQHPQQGLPQPHQVSGWSSQQQPGNYAANLHQTQQYQQYMYNYQQHPQHPAQHPTQHPAQQMHHQQAHQYYNQNYQQGQPLQNVAYSAHQNLNQSLNPQNLNSAYHNTPQSQSEETFNQAGVGQSLTSLLTASDAILE